MMLSNCYMKQFKYLNMKLLYFRLVVLITCLSFSLNIVMAQDNKLKLHAVSIGVGIASSSSNTADGGLGLNMDFSTIINKHIISFNFNSGVKLNSDGPDEDFYELNLTYGRKWFLVQNLILEGHLGIGYFAYDLDTGNIPFFINLPETTIGFPIRVKLIYYPLKSFGVGINPNVNFNSINNTYSANFIIQYNFN